MESEYKIIDNALNTNDFDILKDFVLGANFSWYFEENVVDPGWAIEPLTQDQKDWNFFSAHALFRDSTIVTSPDFWNIIQPILEILKPKALIRAKVNAYTRTPKIVHHAEHMDQDYDHTSALLYLNTNNGLTVLENGTEIKSIANRLLLFNGSKPHHSTTCTDATRRVNLNFNYF
jgi:hypothetical protein